ncbi:hypothetical protein BDA99DRAFT_531978 [Phascolomyces articulosus]|uniref:Uncharacterized protein n=1 Tax=Phascolomyces articulosus TaxID=60185 RepID=A0AAD5KP81_9FUNG|nr:hypothetical protein BDA99DRAFT_531978 [Phascolomyces articulosus]
MADVYLFIAFIIGGNFPGPIGRLPLVQTSLLIALVASDYLARLEPYLRIDENEDASTLRNPVHHEYHVPLPMGQDFQTTTYNPDTGFSNCKTIFNFYAVENNYKTINIYFRSEESAKLAGKIFTGSLYTSNNVDFQGFSCVVNQVTPVFIPMENESNNDYEDFVNAFSDIIKTIFIYDRK